MGKIRNILLITCLLWFSCCESPSSETNEVKKVTRHEYKYFSFETNEAWVEKIQSDTLVTFVKKDDTLDQYRSNFSVMQLTEELSDSCSIDEIAQHNLKEVKSVYSGMKVISYDTIAIKNLEGRKLAFAAITEDHVEIGTILYFLQKGHKLYMLSLQGSNKNGSFKVTSKPLEQIANTLSVR